MSGKKTIKINPAFFNKGKKTKKNRDKKRKPVLENSMKPNNIKKQLLQKIKLHQQKTVSLEKNPVSKEDKEFQNNFTNSMGYLQKMIAEKKKKRKKRATIKNTPKNLSNKPKNKENNGIVSSKPSWGCLKNGTLPTYSQYKKTLKHNEKDKIQLSTPVELKSEEPTSRQNKLNQLKEKFSTEKNKKKLEKLQKVKKKILEKNKTIKLYKLGKRKKENNIGVLIKSGKTRKIIKDEIMVLKQKSITEIKIYLRKHNIIKTGSMAPDSVLRKLYEDSYLAGDIYNKNSENLLHNYINN